MQTKVEEFHKKYGHPINTGFDNEELKFRRMLIKEEYNELCVAFDKGDNIEIINELSDLLYVILGTFVTIGINSEEAIEIIHKANMKKIGIGLNKPIKSLDWKKPDFTEIIKLLEE